MSEDTIERRCNGCGHQWTGPAPVVLCGECWRETWPFIWGGVNAEAAPRPATEDTREALVKRLRAQGHSLMSLGTRRATVVPQAEAKIHQLASLLFEAAEELEAADRLAAPVADTNNLCRQHGGDGLIETCRICRPTPPPPPAEAREEINTLAYQTRVNAEHRPCGMRPCDQEFPGEIYRWCSGCLIAALRAQVQALTEERDRLAAAHVSDQDKEQALDLAIPDDYEHPAGNEQECSYCDGIQSARRFLKLPAREGA